MPHSKGPFVIDDLDKSPARILQAGNTGHALALVYLTDPATRKRSPEFVGNAHLFAASADVLASLKSLVEWARENTSPRDANSPHELLIEAVAAIAKAEGVAQ